MPAWVWVFLILLIAWGWIAGVLFRAGYLQRMGWNLYFNPIHDRPLRNAPITAIPAACGFTILLVSVLLVQADLLQTNSLSGLLFLLLFTAFVVWTLVVAVWPPNFLKPRWLREEEEQRRQRRPAP